MKEWKTVKKTSVFESFEKRFTQIMIDIYFGVLDLLVSYVYVACMCVLRVG